MKLLISSASWEPRNPIGIGRILERGEVTHFLNFFAEEFSQRTIKHRDEEGRLAAEYNVEYCEESYSLFESIQGWKAVDQITLDWVKRASSVVLDITTMPRLLIWTILHHCIEAFGSVEIAYTKPASYSDTWVSRDPLKPLIVPRLGGISRIGAPLHLFVISGFDEQRVLQLVGCFEPACVWIGVQPGEQYDNENQNGIKNRSAFNEALTVRFFTVDSYAPDLGFSQIQTQVREVAKDANVLLTTVGPKPSALALYRIHREVQASSLIYTPSREYNLYSEGAGNQMTFKFSL